MSSGGVADDKRKHDRRLVRVEMDEAHGRWRVAGERQHQIVAQARGREDRRGCQNESVWGNFTKFFPILLFDWNVR